MKKEKDRGKETVGDRSANLIEKKKCHRVRARAKKQRRHFSLEEQHETFVAAGRK